MGAVLLQRTPQFFMFDTFTQSMDVSDFFFLLAAQGMYKAFFSTTESKLKNPPWLHLHLAFKREFIMQSRTEIHSVLDVSQIKTTTARFSGASGSV